jgi:hypothetical protein
MTVHSPVAVFLAVLLILSTVAAMLGLMLGGFSFVDGWRALATRFPSNHPSDGTKFRFQAAKLIGPLPCGCLLNFNISRDGIGIAMVWPFLVGHPPVFIPWPEIRLSEEKSLIFVRQTRLTFPAAPCVSILLHGILADKIQLAAAQHGLS